MASFKNDRELYMLLFKSSLKFYYYNNDKIRETFKVPNKEELMNSGVDQSKLELAKYIREASFNLFIARLTQSYVFKEDGTPYPLGALDKIAEDFVNGKTIYFPGTGTDKYIKLDGKDAQLNQMFVDCNRHRSDPPEEIAVFTDAADEPPVLESSPEKPRRLGWLNSLSKLFRGKPIESWRKYENYLKLSVINAGKLTNETAKMTYNELSKENITKSTHKGYLKRMHENAKKLGEDAPKLSEDAYKDEVLPDPLEGSQVVWNSEKKKFEISRGRNPEPIVEEKEPEQQPAPKEKPAEKKENIEIIEEKPIEKPVEKKAEPKYITGFSEKNADAIKAVSLLIDGSSEGIGSKVHKKSLRANKSLDEYKVRPKLSVFENALKGLESLAKLQEGEAKPDVNTVAGHLTNLYLLGELSDAIKGGNIAPEGEENEFSLIYQNLFIKGDTTIFEEIKNAIIDSKMAENLLKDPSEINKTLFGPNQDPLAGFNKFVGEMRKITHGYLDRTCSYNCELNAFNDQPKGSTSYKHPGEKPTIKSCEEAEKAEAAEKARKAAEALAKKGDALNKAPM